VSFLDISFTDVLDIVLVAILIYQLYRLVKGTVAIKIFLGVLAIYLLWKLVQALNMHVLSEILGQFIGVGVIALIIVFQQEIRRFLLVIGTTGFQRRGKFLSNLLRSADETEVQTDIDAIVDAAKYMAAEKTGALIVVTRNSELRMIAQTGDELDARLSKRLLLSIFNKYSPLHDGAVLISKNRIAAARAVLPATEKSNLPAHLGMRHRAAIGVTEQSDAVCVIVSEETGKVSYAIGGEIRYNLEDMDLQKQLEKDLRD
jgi:uncharacterized protein (TIGR00159 family)